MLKKLAPIAALTLIATALSAQQPTTPEPQEPQPPRGTVILHRSTDEDQNPDQQKPPDTQQQSSSSSSSSPTPDTTDANFVPPTDTERASLTFTFYDIELHVAPATSHLSAHALFTIKNTGAAPLQRIALQLSSTLHWEAVTLRAPDRILPLPYVQHPVDTDADHTGQAAEAVITLPQPLAPGSSLDLTAFYAGEIPASAQRLERIGAPPAQSADTDWDSITPTFTALRGFGNVLWYPTASPPLLLGDGAKLFNAVGLAKFNQSTATIHLRLAVEYSGEPPAAAYFCGRREILHPIPESADTSVSQTPGIATAEFPAFALGFRTPSLFIVPANASATDNMLISAVTARPNVLPSYNSGAQLVRPMLSDWLGPNPLEPLIILDHPGQPFEDNAFVVAPMKPASANELAPALAHSLTHAWFRSSLPWLNEGVAQFMTLLWLEQDKGREAALAQLQSQVSTLALAEPQAESQPTPGSDPKTTGQPLIRSHSETYYGTKATAVLWMLRPVVGDAALKQTLTLYRNTVAQNPKAETPQLFEHLLEEASHKDLAWFFNDWVYNDRGLADLSIANVIPRDLSNNGETTWLVAVEVRNDGDAAVDVPITVRSGKLTKSTHLHLPGRTSATTRITFEGVPDEIQINNGTIPEVTTPIHIQKLNAASRTP